MLKSIRADQIVNHQETNTIMGNNKHGFRCQRSCLTGPLQFFLNIISIYDDSRATGILYLDFEKAFDNVPHKGLLTKVRAPGVGVEYRNGLSTGSQTGDSEL
ncbi:putative RNA-directed DNA polymerase from transposon BS [Dictyocoela roeselum]|nr:putative RNA-directed DNA polymerase from transposon BS [Dictyocoela roeselum]